MVQWTTHHRASRRGFLRGSVVGALGLAALGMSSHHLGVSPLQSSNSSGPWLGGDVPPAARSSRQMAAAARAFLNGLDQNLLGRVWYQDVNDPARTGWTNFPAGMAPRPGASLGDLNDAQRALLHELLRASTSSQGYHKLTAAIRADDVLSSLEGGNSLFGAAQYYVTVFGSPDSSSWGWMLTGHHMSAIFTVVDERTAFMPMFTGAQPLQIPSGLHAGWQVLPQEAARASELLATLSDSQRASAVIGSAAPMDLLAGPGRRESLSTFQGLAASEMDDVQQRLLWLLVQEFVGNADFDAAEAQLALIRDTWSDVHFAWLGPAPDPTTRFYFRVHGPRILIEYDVQEPLAQQGGHIHAVVRDPVNDYGMDWLGQHYEEHPPQPSPGGPGPGSGGPMPGGPPNR